MRWITKNLKLTTGVVAAFILAVAAVGSAHNVWADSATSKSGERLVVIHDGDTEQGIITKATTVRKALEEAKIIFDNNDLVEPRLDETLVASSYDINIYRARPITIIDGAVRKKIMSAYRTPAQIVEHAGMKLQDEDITEMGLSTAVLGSGATMELTITRATPFNLVLYGKKVASYTQARTVAAMLEGKNITLGSDDTLSLDPKTSITAGMTVEIWREGKQTITEEEDVQFKVEQIQDVDRDIGFREIVTPGALGRRTATYEIEIRNGVEVDRREIQSVIITEAKTQVERIGVKPKYVPYTGGGNKTDWLRAAGIAEEYWGYADALVSRESGWNPNAINRNSGACGLAQALPCGKVPGNPLDPVDSLRWMNGYVNGRYGGWEGAYSFWQRNKWY